MMMKNWMGRCAFCACLVFSQMSLAQEPEPPPVDEVNGGDEQSTETQEEFNARANEDSSFQQEEPLAYEPQASTGPFSRGTIRLGILLGYTSVTNGFQDTSWLILGGGLGYYVYDGLEVGLDSSFWVIGDPFITTITPGVRYVFHQVPLLKPYVGTFYRRYLVSKFADSDSLGARAGLLFMTGKRSYFGGGLVYEHLFEKKGNSYFAEDDYFYPELTLALSF